MLQRCEDCRKVRHLPTTDDTCSCGGRLITIAATFLCGHVESHTPAGAILRDIPMLCPSCHSARFQQAAR